MRPSSRGSWQATTPKDVALVLPDRHGHARSRHPHRPTRAKSGRCRNHAMLTISRPSITKVKRYPKSTAAGIRNRAPGESDGVQNRCRTHDALPTPRHAPSSRLPVFGGLHPRKPSDTDATPVGGVSTVGTAARRGRGQQGVGPAKVAKVPARVPAPRRIPSRHW